MATFVGPIQKKKGFVGPVSRPEVPPRTTPIKQAIQVAQAQPKQTIVPARTTPIQAVIRGVTTADGKPTGRTVPAKFQDRSAEEKAQSYGEVVNRTFANPGGLEGFLTAPLRGIAKAGANFIEPVLERGAAIGESIEQRSLEPLGVSLTQQLDEYDISKGTSLEDKVRRASNIALSANMDARIGFNSRQYVDELVAKQKAVTPKAQGVVGKTKEFLSDVKRKLVDYTAPLQDPLAKNQKEFKYQIRPQYDIGPQIDRVQRSSTIAKQFIDDNGLSEVIRKAPDLDELNQYLIAKQSKSVAARGIETGRDAIKDDLLIEALAPRYEKQAKIVTDYSKQLKQYAVDTGLISKELSRKLDEIYPDYVPLNRVMDEIESSGGSKSVASLSRQTLVRKLEGSTREIQNPIDSLISKTNEVVEQGEKNRAAQLLAGYKDLPANPFQITPLRTAENVRERISLYTEAKELKPLQNKVDSLISTRSGELRRLQTELNRLNKQGVKEATRKTGQTVLPTVQSSVKIKSTPATAERVRFGADDVLLQRTPGKPAKVEATDASFAIPNTRDVKKFIDELITDPKTDVEAIKRKIATRENKLGPLLDTIEDLRNQYDDIKGYRMELFEEARLLKDAKTKGKDIFSVFRDGIKEIYETTPEIAAAAKNLNEQQLNVLGKILAAPVRVARVGITGLNLPFVASNLVKDQAFAFVNSSKALSTSIAHPVNFVKALFGAVGHGELYKQAVRQGAGGTIFDISRSALPNTVERIRAGSSFKSKIKYTVRHPSELFRAVEDVIGRGEELTRLQQFVGTREALLKQGRSLEDANILAAQAYNNNTTNFRRRGEYGNVLNSAFLYMNAGIQGSRTLLRSFINAPVQTTTKVATAVMMPAATVTLWNLSDDRRKEAYNDIPEYEKKGSLIIIPPFPEKDDNGKWNVIKIPLAPGLDGFANVTRNLIENAEGNDPTSIKEVAQNLIGTVSPVEPSKTGVLNRGIPQAIRPTIELYSNKDFFTGKQIVPDYLKEQFPNDPEKQAYKNTSGTARKIANVLDVSPLQVDYFIKKTFGEVGSQGINASDRILAGLNVIPREQIGGRSISQGLLNRFGQATGGEQERDVRSELDKRLIKQKGESFTQYLEAEQLYEEMKGLNPAEANAKAKALYETNRTMYNKLRDVAEDDKLGITPNDRRIKRLGVENGERAEWINEELGKLKTNDEKNAYLKELWEKKILTKDVYKQLEQLIKK